MDIGKAFEVAFNRKKEKNWEKIYVVVDIHDTILRACYENEETYDYYPYAREALQLMTNRDDICMILWSGCYDEQMAVYRSRFAEEGIHFDYSNENPEVGKTSFQNFEVNWVPLSDMILLGTPWKHTILVMYIFANLALV